MIVDSVLALWMISSSPLPKKIQNASLLWVHLLTEQVIIDKKVGVDAITLPLITMKNG